MEPKKINRKTVETTLKKTLLSCAFESENQISNLADCHPQKRKVCNIDVIKSSKPFSKFQHMY